MVSHVMSQPPIIVKDNRPDFGAGDWIIKHDAWERMKKDWKYGLKFYTNGCNLRIGELWSE